MKRNKRLSMNKGLKYLPIFIILLSISIIIGTTFAYFTDKEEENGALTFAKVELSNESTVGINGSLKDVIPGTPLISTPVQFSKAIDSEAIYVRAKLSFSVPSAYKNDSKMLNLLDDIRNSTEFNINSEEQHDAVWSNKQGNYYYLLSSTDNSKLKVVDTTDTYTLSNEIVVPRDLESLEDNYQYMKSINFHVAFEAIQADNVSDVLSETKETFNVIFPEIEEEMYSVSYTLTLKGLDLTTNFGEVKVRDGEMTQEPQPPQHSDPQAQFAGWYTEKECINKFEFGTTINQNYTLYPKYVAGEKLTIMGTDNNVLEEIIVDSNGYTKEPTSLQLPVDAEGTHTKAVEGWYTDTSYENKFVFGNKLEESTTLYPKVVNVSTGLTFWEIYEEVGEDGPTSWELVGYSVNKGECTDTEVIVPAIYKGLPVIEVGMSAFNMDGNLTKIVLPSTISTIAESAFSECYSLTEINLPSSLIEIKDSAFSNCVNMALTSLPESLEIIGDTAFNICRNLALSKLPSGLTYLGRCAFGQCEKLSITSIPTGVTSIEASMFYGCIGLTSLTLHDGIETIGDSAFSDCLNLTITNLSESLKQVGFNAFYSIKEITNLNIGKDCIDIAQGAFERVGNIVSINVHKDNAIYNDGNGSNCLIDTANKTIIKGCANSVIPTSESMVTSIGDGAFSNLLNLYTITIPSNISSIGYAFEGCYKLVQIRNLSGCDLGGCPWTQHREDIYDATTPFQSTLETDEDGWQIFTSANNVKCLFGYVGEGLSGNIPNFENVTRIYQYAFYQNSNINTTTIPDSVIYSEEYAFAGCQNITEITFGTSMNTVGNSLFQACENLTTVNFSNAQNWVSSSAFANCTSLTNIVLPTAINIDTGVFGGCTSLPMQGNYRYIPFVDGDIFIVECLDKSLSEIVIPTNTKMIGSDAFADMVNIEEVEVPEGVTSLGWTVFRGCTSLVDVSLPDSLTKIDIGVFMYCSSLVEISIPANVDGITNQVFQGCINLRKLVINNVNTYFGADTTLDNTPNLKGIIINGTNGRISNDINNTGKDIYYNGTQEQWNALEGAENITANVYFYKEGCFHTNQGFWQYDSNGYPVAGESFVEVVKQEATCNAAGVKDLVCCVCNEVIIANTSIPKLPHKFVDGECTECHTEINYTIARGENYGFGYYEMDGNLVFFSENRYVDSTTSTMTLTAQADMVISFEYWVDAYEGDYFVLTKGGEELLRVENTNWVYLKYSVTISSGESLTFSYVKDEMGSGGNDCVEMRKFVIADV